MLFNKLKKKFDFLIEKSLYLNIQYLINQTGPTFKSLEKLPFGSFFLCIPPSCLQRHIFNKKVFRLFVFKQTDA